MQEMLTINQYEYDFMDFGCSYGANIELVQRLCPGLRGCGFDIDQRKIDKARASGLTAYLYDINALPKKKLASFVTMSHFLEHLPSVRDAQRMIHKAVDVARDFIYIRQPFFDADGPLMHKGLKLYWSHWRGHPNKMTSLDFVTILEPLRVSGAIVNYDIYFKSPILTSDDVRLLPLMSPIDQQKYASGVHGPKPAPPLSLENVFAEVVVLVEMQSITSSTSLLGHVNQLTSAYSSRAAV